MIISVEDICFGYSSTPVLDRVRFQVKKGQVTVILGPNGVGKTTLLKCLNRIIRPQSGQVRIQGTPLAGMGLKTIASRISYVAQKNRGARFTVYDAVLMGRTPHLGYRVTARDLEKTDAVMEKLDLTRFGLKPLDSLSGGELQKVAIARALVQETEVILMDEPTASLDLKNQMEILSLVRHIARSHGTAVVMTLHDLNSALRYADEYLCLKNGRICGTGAMDGLTPDLVRQVYGVDVEIVSHRGCPMVVPVAA